MKVDCVIIHSIRSAHNVGSILRTCDGLGVTKVYIGGVSPYPKVPYDQRLPHIIEKQTKDIHKTALGSETMVEIHTYDDISSLITELKVRGLLVVALEQSSKSIDLSELTSIKPIALLLGNEVEGIDKSLLDDCDEIVVIKMSGQKESFNVSVATGIALYALCS